MSMDSSTLTTDVQTLVAGFLRLIDVTVVIVTGVLAFWLRHDTFDLPYYYQAALLMAAIFIANYAHIAGVYRPDAMRSNLIQAVRMAVAWSGVTVTLIGLAYFMRIPDWFSSAWAVYWYFLAIGGFFLFRAVNVVQKWRWRRQGHFTTNVAVIGSRAFGATVIRQLAEDSPEHVRIVGVFDDPPPKTPMIEGWPVRGDIDDLIALTRTERVDEIVLAMVDRSEEEIEAILAKLRPVPINTKLCAQSLRLNVPVRGFSSVAGLPLLHVFERPLKGWGGFWKTLEDLVLGSVILILFLPLLAIVALAVKFDSPGPVLFRQKRYGFNNDEITVFKFRSMYVERKDDPLVRQARRNDPRITRVGAFIRRTSLDELPQLFNVLRGEMSLVGPRPHAVAHNEQYAKIIDGYLGRHRVKPGITGWAQVHGLRGETDTPEKMRMRVQYDLFYIDNWSLAMDIRILLMTAVVGFVNKNAY